MVEEDKYFYSKKKKPHKLFKWEGWKKEIGWIVFFIFLILLVLAYRADTQQVKEISQTECYKDCVYRASIKQTLLEHPDWQLICNDTTKQCEVAGVNPYGDGYGNGYVLDMDLIKDDTNNTRENTSTNN